MGRTTDPAVIIELLEQGSRRGLSQAISLAENGGAEKEIILNYAFRKQQRNAAPVLVVGITGPGGAGKSTLIDKLLKEYRAQGKTVGVIAVDPSSPFTGGAFLGDRVRMSEHSTDNGVFIRSLGSRMSLGGLSDAAKNVLYLYKAYGFDIVLVESLGVGQDEVEIAKYVDVTVVMMIPGMGDSIQLAKAGILEAADVFIINKSDKPEAEILKEQLLNSFGTIPPDRLPPIVSTVASEGIGIKEVVSAVQNIANRDKASADRKLRARILAEIHSAVTGLLNSKFDWCIAALAEKVHKGDITPCEAAKILAERIEYRED